VKWNEWKEKYEWIVDKLGLDRERDRLAAKVLSDLINGSDLSGLINLIKGRECIIFGAGPSLENDLKRLKEAGWLDKTVISADGATSCVKEYCVPDVIVTDLDGETSDQLLAWRRGSWMVVHGHGDNIKEIKRVVPKVTDRIVGTTQVVATGKIYNFGGFTDGDRAAFLANELGASRIILAGMDLGRKIGKYTGKTDKKIKLIKLEISRKLLSWLAEEFEANLVNVTLQGEHIPGIPQEDLFED